MCIRDRYQRRVRGKFRSRMAGIRRALVVGGNGALGRSIAGAFRNNPEWHIISADVVESRVGADPHSAHEHIKLPTDWHRDVTGLAEQVGELDFLVSVAGGFGMGALGEPDCLSGFHEMWEMNTSSAMAAAQLGTQVIKPGGMIVLTGALGALDETPAFVGYGMAKSAVHQLVLSYPDDGIPPNDIEICAILP
eukprot:TRINITY_DN11135_c0_g1_i1.p1 TRINITY_DN11135_c0_g1~~TRINITY_DN11135_c0_g1_i1.p1  ORF type:complete len:193 (+),score=36.99 TRINITY_DN11135_c0_g1_i1:146-724(+)